MIRMLFGLKNVLQIRLHMQCLQTYVAAEAATLITHSAQGNTS